MARDDYRQAEGAEVVELIRPRVEPAWANAAASGPTALQYAVALALAGGLLTLAISRPGLAFAVVHAVFFTVFALAAGWRALAVVIAAPPRRIRKLCDADLPSYTVIAPLYKEAAMATSLLAALTAIDYPEDRLQILIVLEADDGATLQAVRQARGSNRVRVVIAPPASPKTKPRACNVALAEATGDLVVVYDAEDRPHPLQLREAAARFAAGDRALGCLQAPLRILAARRMLPRQFALEYAAQFEIILPALVRLGAPFPLGGTSNHFRTEALRKLGGWDAWNVTEDADLGFRLAAEGWTIGLLRTPTWESAPENLKSWVPQRARWAKGYMQTWGVHMRAPLAGGLRRFAAMQATLGLAILSILAHGPAMMTLLAFAAFSMASGRGASAPPLDMALLVAGWSSAILSMAAGARRAGLRLGWRDAALAPAYWALQSWAGLHAIWQLCTRPYHWNKTPHVPSKSGRIGAGLRAAPLDAKGAASVRRAA